MDYKNILPGQNWDFEIQRELTKASVIVVFLSHISVNHRGYVQRELKFAIDRMQDKLIDDVYLIPVLLDEGLEIPQELRAFHAIAASDPECIPKITAALEHQAARIGNEVAHIQEASGASWTFSKLLEQHDGIPGYEFECRLIEFTATGYPHAAEIGTYIRGHFLGELFRHREDRLSPMPDLFNFGQNRYRRTNTYDAHCDGPMIQGQMVSFAYSVYWYGAGAAHPNQHFETFCFVLDPLFRLEKLASIFLDPDEALRVIQVSTRQQLLDRVLVDQGGDGIAGAVEAQGFRLDRDQVITGTEKWSDFSNFVFGENAIDFNFPPYQVAAYVFGPQFAQVSYASLASLMRPEFRSILEIEHLRHGGSH